MSTQYWSRWTLTKSAWSVKAIAGSPISIARSQLRSMDPLGPSYDHSVWTWRSACTALDSALLAPKGPFTAAHSARLAGGLNGWLHHRLSWILSEAETTLRPASSS